MWVKELYFVWKHKFLHETECPPLYLCLEAYRYKIQDTRCIFRASEATLSGFLQKRPRASAPKKHKTYASTHNTIQECRRRRDWVFRITITSHRWSWVNIYKFTGGPWVQKSSEVLLFLTRVEEITSPAGLDKRGPFGSPIMGRRGERSDSCVGRYYVHLYIQQTHNNNNSTYIILCT